MTVPDYKIEEFFDPEQVRVYFRVHVLLAGTIYDVVGPRFDTLEQAKECVRMCRKYEKPIFHYVED